MKKVFSILHTESSLGWGGQEIRILEEAKGLRGRGHRIIILCQPESKLSAKAKEVGLEVIAFSMRKISYPVALLRLLRVIEDYNVDILNTHSSRDSWLASIAGRLSKRKPVILRTRHLSTPISKSPLSRFLYERLPHRVITTGEAIRKQIITDTGLNGNRIISIPTGVDLDLFDSKKVNGTLRKELKIPEEVPVIGMVAVIRSWKGHEDFVDAAERILKLFPEARFLIVGDGPRKGIVRKYIEGKGLEDFIIMTGHREDIPQVMASLDIFVLSSYANEGLPQAVAQAMAMEKAVVASNIGSIPEIVIDGETGYLIPPRDPSLFAERIISLLKDNRLREEMGKAGRRLVASRFSLETMLDRIEELYEEVIKESDAK